MGFAAEIKDFLNAWQAGEKITASQTDREYKLTQNDALKKKTDRDNDPDALALQDQTARAKLKQIESSTGATGANTAYINERRNALRLQQDLMRKQAAAGPAGSGLLPGGDGTGALPLNNTMTLDDEAAPAYADGGMVEEQPDAEPDADVDDTPAVGALPVGGTPTDVSAQSRQRGPNLDGIVSPQLVRDATRQGLTWGANAFGLGKVGGIRTNQQKLAAQQFAQGRGGLTDEEMSAAKKAIDPESKLSEAQRNMAALGSVYQYQMNKGNPEGAQRVAFQMLQHYRVAAQRYAAIAAHAANAGDLDLATKAAVKAYANIPDGRDVEIFKDDDGKLNFSYTDATTGKTIAKGLVTPQQLASSAMGIAQGGFDKALLTAAGAAEKAQGGGKGAGALKTSDRKSLGEMANEPVSKFEEEYKVRADKEKLPALDPEYLNNLRDATQHILTDNPKATPREAFKAARGLYALDKEDAGKSTFKVTKDDNEEGLNKIKFASGHTIKLSDDQLEPILIARAAKIKAQDAKDDAEEDAKDEPGIMDKVGALGSAIGNAASDAWTAIKARDPQVRARQGAIPVPEVEAMPQ